MSLAAANANGDDRRADDEEEGGPSEASGNRTRMALILLLALATLSSVGRTVASSFVPAGGARAVSGAAFGGASEGPGRVHSAYGAADSESSRGSRGHFAGGNYAGEPSGGSGGLRRADIRQAISEEDSESPDRRIPKHKLPRGPKNSTTPESSGNRQKLSSPRGRAEPPDKQQSSKDDQRIRKSSRGSKGGGPAGSRGSQQPSPRGKADSSDDARSPSPSERALPIYLLRPSSNLTARMPWGDLARGWNRTTRYEDLLGAAAPAPSLPAAAGGDGARRRPVVMVHCGPKTGSTTLRVACRRALEETCGVDRRANGQFPVGYMDESKLYPLVRRCANTSHFCVKEVTMPFDVPAYEDVAFVHMFPFRQYDEWARSALKQQYDRGRESGCRKTEEKLEECTPSRMEIDFRKYGKTQLSKFKEGAVRRMDEIGERHVFVLYHHRELDAALERMSEVYGIPTLPGSDGKGKERRPEGTCDERLLGMFHDCFSSQLMELT